VVYAERGEEEPLGERLRGQLDEDVLRRAVGKRELQPRAARARAAGAHVRDAATGQLGVVLHLCHLAVHERAHQTGRQLRRARRKRGGRGQSRAEERVEDEDLKRGPEHRPDQVCDVGDLDNRLSTERGGAEERHQCLYERSCVRHCRVREAAMD
jgi:hypothetical protein